MKHYGFLFLGFSLFVLLSFALFEWLEIPLLKDPTFLLENRGITTASISMALLGLDILLPIPASIIMIANGAIFGIVLGAIISLAGALIANITGYFIGKKSGQWLDRFVTQEERNKAHQLMQRWGMIAVIITRPIPILSESVIVMAGTTLLPFNRMLLATILGLLPGVLIYALTGAYAVTLNNQIISFLIVIGIAFLFWLAGFLIKKRV